MTDSLLTLPLRLGVRTVRVSLLAGRDLADLGLAALELVERVLGEEEDHVGAEDVVEVEPDAEDVVDLEAVDVAAEPAADRGGAKRSRRRPRRASPRVRPVPPSPREEAPREEAPPEEAPREEAPAEEVPAEEAPPEEAPREPGLVAEEPARPEVEEPIPDDRELVEELADPGAEQGAGAALRVAPPFPGYDELRAPDVIARLPSLDVAELGETELYERTHRARRTVLDAIAREIKRRPPA